MRTEKVLAAIFLVGLGLKFTDMRGAGPALILALSLLALLYFAGAFYFFSDQNMKRQHKPLSISTGILLAVIPFGMLFKLQYWPGAQPLLLAGTVIAPFLLGWTFFLRSRSADELGTYFRNMVVRTSLLGALAIFFYLIPSESLIKAQYRFDPELARLKTLHYLHPGNQDYKRQHDAYEAKVADTNLDNPESPKNEKL